MVAAPFLLAHQYAPFWLPKLAPGIHWQKAYADVEAAVKGYLEGGGDTLSTNELVEALWPEQFARGEGITARRRLYKALLALATHGLADYCERGPEKKLRHGTRVIQPWVWRAPKAKPWEPTREDLIRAVLVQSMYEDDAIDDEEVQKTIAWCRSESRAPGELEPLEEF